MEKVGYIRDPKEREHYTLKRCCANCKHRRSESPTWPFFMRWCVKKKKHLGCDPHYDHGCKVFEPLATPEQNKQWSLIFKAIFREFKNDKPIK